MSRESLPVSDGDLAELAVKLDRVTSDLVARLAIAGTDPWSRSPISGPFVQSQPCSRPPYNMHAGVTLDELGNELSTTIRHLCEHRCMEVPVLGSLTAQAQWLKKHRVAIQVMPDAREIFTGLCRAIDAAVRSVSIEEQEYRIPKDRAEEMIAAANEHEVDAGRVEKLAAKLGDQAKGLNRNRVDYLRRRGLLVGEFDEESGKWWYLLGDVLAAHKRAQEQRATRRRSGA